MSTKSWELHRSNRWTCVHDPFALEFLCDPADQSPLTLKQSARGEYEITDAGVAYLKKGQLRTELPVEAGAAGHVDLAELDAALSGTPSEGLFRLKLR